MRQTALPFALLAALLPSCVASKPPPPSETDSASKGSLLTRTSPEDNAAQLVFPPPDRGRTARPSLKGSATSSQSGPEVVTPYLQGTDPVDITGDRFRIGFNQPMAWPPPAAAEKRASRNGTAPGARLAGGAVVAAPESLVITPAVKGTLLWLDAYTLEFHATEPMKVGERYRVEVGDVRSKTGGLRAASWTATMIPRAVVAGKVLGHTPKVGSPRVVSMYPTDGSTVGPRPEIAVLYDQPVDPTKAQSLVRLEDEGGSLVPMALSHPLGPTFQGVPVDPRFVVLVRTPPLERGKQLTLRSMPAEKGTLGSSAQFRVASPLAVKGIECPSTEDCTVDTENNAIYTEDSGIDFRLNNPLSLKRDELQKLVRVTPKVDHLSVYGPSWDDGVLHVSGAFQPSTRYEITLLGLTDRYGSRLPAPVRATVFRSPRDASVTMPSGVLVLDEARLKRFELTTMNAEQVEMRFWPVPDADMASAVRKAHAGTSPTDEPAIKLNVPVEVRENSLVTTPVDLAQALGSSVPHLASVRIESAISGADLPGNEARAPLALIVPGSANALAAHAEKMASRTLIHVARLGTGEAVAGAEITLLDTQGATSPFVTRADGLALLPGDALGWARISTGSTQTLLNLSQPDTTARKLFPALSNGREITPGVPRAMMFTDRGIYRPGAKVHLYTSMRSAGASGLSPFAGQNVVATAIGPSGERIHSETLTTNDLGSASASFEVPKTAKLGRHRVVVHAGSANGDVIGETMVQVAEVEPPRFAVDVDVSKSDARTLKASIAARYLFGAKMSGATVKWTASREPVAVAEGAFAGLGLSFRPARDSAAAWSRSGETTADAGGMAKIEQALSGTSGGPERLFVEAEVTDSSHRAIAGRSSVTIHSAARYAGLRVGKRWVAPGERLDVKLGVVDREGRAVVAAPVSAVLSRVEYTEIARRDSGGELVYEWSERKTQAGRCAAKSATAPVECSLIIPSAGQYEIAAEVDGHSAGGTHIWAFREGDGDDAPHLPGRGRALPIVTDKSTYAAGDTAKLFFTSPFPAATAIITTDAPGAEPHTQLIDGTAGVIEIPITSADVPHLHALVTLLPRKASRAEGAGKGLTVADYRFGAVRLPASATRSRLRLEVTPSKPTFGPRDEATIAMRVTDDSGAPVKGAEIALAVVDEGVLRMTGHHAPDPVTDLRPGRALSAEIFDTRAAIADLVSQSHVAGDGDSTPSGKPTGRRDTERPVTKARQQFAETAFWSPHLRTDAEGRVTARFVLPDNLTEMRAMAVALDGEGRGAVSETSFHVTKPLLLAPALPRFVSLGDRFEATTLVHNNSDTPALVKVVLSGRARRLLVPAQGHVRVSFPLWVTCDRNDDDEDNAQDDLDLAEDQDLDATAGEASDEHAIRACPLSEHGEPASIRLRFDVESHDGTASDAVETAIFATSPGLDERPRLEGTFVKERTVSLEVPAHVTPQGADDKMVIALGAQMWPELGERLRYLLDYPHGCVEQTTSSTLPLLAARDIAPRIGMEGVTDADLTKKIQAGIARLGTMRTSSGGLAYWPGGTEPNTYGTAYAIRAMVLAKQAGIEPPSGLVEGMARYLADRMLSLELEPEVRAAIAQSLAELGALDPGAADALFERRETQTVFGNASLALALAALPGQDDRVKQLLDAVEAGIDDKGELREAPKSSDFHYYGSPARTKAQAAIALRRLRPTSGALAKLVSALAQQTGSYTTQATAYSLLALAEEVRRLEPDTSAVTVVVDGQALSPARELPGGGRQFEVPLTSLSGKTARLTLSSSSEKAIGFVVRAAWRIPAASADDSAFHTTRGPSVYRIYTDAKGNPVDLTRVKAGDVLRVALIARRPEGVDSARYGYVALTDRLPSGFEPVQQDLATVAAQPELDSSHPFASWLLYPDERPSHLELHDDRVNVYFDRASGDDVAATYLVRATTPGRFAIPPATGELMYEADSLGATEASAVVIR